MNPGVGWSEAESTANRGVRLPLSLSRQPLQRMRSPSSSKTGLGHEQLAGPFGAVLRPWSRRLRAAIFGCPFVVFRFESARPASSTSASTNSTPERLRLVDATSTTTKYPDDRGLRNRHVPRRPEHSRTTSTPTTCVPLPSPRERLPRRQVPLRNDYFHFGNVNAYFLSDVNDSFLYVPNRPETHASKV